MVKICLAGVAAAVPQCGPRLHPNLSNVMKTLTLCRRIVAGLGWAGLGAGLGLGWGWAGACLQPLISLLGITQLTQADAAK